VTSFLTEQWILQSTFIIGFSLFIIASKDFGSSTSLFLWSVWQILLILSQFPWKKFGVGLT